MNRNHIGVIKRIVAGKIIKMATVMNQMNGDTAQSHFESIMNGPRYVFKVLQMPNMKGNNYCIWKIMKIKNISSVSFPIYFISAHDHLE